MAGLVTERKNKIMAQKEKLRKLALAAESFQSFEDASEELVQSIDVFDLLEEFKSQGGGCLETYYKNIRGELWKDS